MLTARTQATRPTVDTQLREQTKIHTHKHYESRYALVSKAGAVAMTLVSHLSRYAVSVALLHVDVMDIDKGTVSH